MHRHRRRLLDETHVPPNDQNEGRMWPLALKGQNFSTFRILMNGDGFLNSAVVKPAVITILLENDMRSNVLVHTLFYQSIIMNDFVFDFWLHSMYTHTPSINENFHFCQSKH